MKEKTKINILLDSNIRNRFYKDFDYHNLVIGEVKRFGEKKNLYPLNFSSTFTTYEEAGLGKLDNLDIRFSDVELNKLKETKHGSEEEAKILFDLAENFLIESLKKIKSIPKYNRTNIEIALKNKLPHINHSELEKRFTEEFISSLTEDEIEVLHGEIAFEYLQDKYLNSEIDANRRARFLLSLFYHFPSDLRSNSLFRSAHQIWTESFVQTFSKDNPELSPFLKELTSKIKINSREDFVDNEIIHLVVMGKRRKGSMIKFLSITNDPIECVLYRIALYKFIAINSKEIGENLPRPVLIPGMNMGYIGFLHTEKLKWLSVASIPALSDIQDISTIPDLISRLNIY